MTQDALREKFNEIIAIDEGIAMAYEAYLSVVRDDVERARLLREDEYELEIQSRLVHAKREGMEAGKIESARNLKRMGLPIVQIAEGTGLTEQQINEL